MGSACSCLLVEDIEEYPHSSSSAFRNCICLRCLTQQLLSVHAALFQREVRAVTVQDRITFAPQALSVDDSLPDTYQSPLRPIPYDDPRFSHPQRDGFFSNHGKFIGHIHEESEPCRSNNNQQVELLMDGKCSSKLCQPESSLKNSAEARKEVKCILSSSDDEDVCPTCLEEYSSEDPRIVMQCSHHFHLGCIYEWMERSETCPVCGKMMVFKEGT